MGMSSTHTSVLPVLLGASGLKGKTVTRLSKRNGVTDFIQSIISKKEEQDPFYVLDLGVLVSLMDKWSHSLPSIRPFYAVKCNPHQALLGALAALGAGFDCASPAEIDMVLELGISPSRIVYANPCKAESHIRYAASVGVNLTTFDSLDEIDKIQRCHPTCELLLRIKASDDSGAIYPMGSKYGALAEEVKPLLQACHAARLAVIGVSFHVGSCALHSRTYRNAIAASKAVFDTAMSLGMPRFRLLDVGGGFVVGSLFNEIATTITEALCDYFPGESGLTIISEPGRFFAATAFTLVAQIIGTRVRGKRREYWINDGIYGSFRGVIYNEPVTAEPLAWSSNRSNPTCKGEKTCTSTIFGHTLDGVDTVLKGDQLPELQLNDWLVFPNSGAYSSACASNFNGFNSSTISTHLVFSDPIDDTGCPVSSSTLVLYN